MAEQREQFAAKYLVCGGIYLQSDTSQPVTLSEVLAAYETAQA